jgi:tetratricopeptide (TPR) repeat protein
MIAIALALALGPPSQTTTASGRGLTEGSKALTDFRPAEALALLEQAKREGPYDHARFVQLHEQLAIAYAYLGRTEESQREFELMLALDPGRSISYTLSPKVTFPFERARESVTKIGPPAIDVRWPSDMHVGDKVPLDVELVADPERFLKSATIYTRTKGETAWGKADLELPSLGTSRRIWISTRDPGHSAALELYLVARDAAGDEVYAWSTPGRPREIQLAFEPPDPWYGKWWVWSIVAGVVAAGTAGAVLAAKHEPSRTVDGMFGVQYR